MSRALLSRAVRAQMAARSRELGSRRAGRVGKCRGSQETSSGPTDAREVICSWLTMRRGVVRAVEHLPSGFPLRLRLVRPPLAGDLLQSSPRLAERSSADFRFSVTTWSNPRIAHQI